MTTCIWRGKGGSVSAICLALLLVAPRVPAADEAQISWLSLTRSSPPSKLAELRAGILTFLEPYRRKLFGDPQSVLVTTCFFSVSFASETVHLSATSTNVDGTLACVLSASELQALQQRILNTNDVVQIAAPRGIFQEGMRAKASITRTAQIGGTNQSYGQKVDLVHRVNGTNVHLRVIAEATDAITNSFQISATAPITNVVSIVTFFQSALEARVPSGGGVAVWHKPSHWNESTYLLLFSPVIQTSLSPPFPGAPLAPKRPGL